MTHSIRLTLLALALLAPNLAASLTPAWAASVTNSDKQFLTDSAQGANYELALAKLAQQKATQAEVKSFADRLASDHTTQNAALEKLMAAKGVSPSTGLKAADQSRLTQMSSQSGATFDTAFANEMARINDEDKKSTAAEKSSTSDADIKGFLGQFASMDSEHEKAALALQGK